MYFPTFNAYHLGDNLLHLHFLRGLARRYPEHTFQHYPLQSHLNQLDPLVADLPNLSLGDFEQVPVGALNAWRGARGWFYGQPDRHDFAAIHLRWFAHLAQQMGLESPFYKKTDLLFDYPALAPRSVYTGQRSILVINSQPLSGQFPGYSRAGFDDLIARLHAAGHSVFTTAPSSTPGALCTRDLGSSVTDIGRLSADHIFAIIGTATGPIWPTFNIWNADTIKLRLIFLSEERVDLLPEHTVHANSLTLAPEILRDHGLL